MKIAVMRDGLLCKLAANRCNTYDVQQVAGWAYRVANGGTPLVCPSPKKNSIAILVREKTPTARDFFHCASVSNGPDRGNNRLGAGKPGMPRTCLLSSAVFGSTRKLLWSKGGG